jgi:hypothetical protein
MSQENSLFQDIIEIIDSFIKRQLHSNRVRAIATLVVGLIATALIVFALIIAFNNKDLVYIGAALIALAGVFFGTIGFGILSPYFTNIERINYTRTLKERLEKHTDPSPDKSIKKFNTDLTELFKTLLK